MSINLLNIVYPCMSTEEKNKKNAEDRSSLLFLLGHFSDEDSALKSLLPELALKIIHTKTALHVDEWLVKSMLSTIKVENANKAINEFKNIRC